MTNYVTKLLSPEESESSFRTMTFAMLAYIAAIAGAEFTGMFIGIVLSTLWHAILIPVLLSHYALAKQAPYRRILPVLALVPLLRILSLTMPVKELAYIYWYALIGTPLLLAIILTIRLLALPWPQVGLGRVAWPAQALIAWSGLPLGIVAYLFVQPQPMFTGFSWHNLLLGSLILLVFTAFIEELLFRGLLQRVAIELWGHAGILYSGLLFATMYVGSLSPSYVLFVGLVGVFFGWCTQGTGSIWGVTLAHGIINVILLLVMPYLAQQGTLTMHTTIAWAAGSGALLSIVAISVMIRRTQREDRLPVPSVPIIPITQPLLEIPTAAITQPLPDISPSRQSGGWWRRTVGLPVTTVKSGVLRRAAQSRWLWVGSICLLAVLSIGIARLITTGLDGTNRLVNNSGLPVAPMSSASIPVATPTSTSVSITLASPVATSTTISTVVPTVTPTIMPTSPASTSTSLPRPSVVATASTPVAATPTPALGTNDTQAQPSDAPVQFINETFNSPTGGWPNRTTNTASTVYQDGRYQLVLDGQQSTGVSTAFSVPDYRLSVDMTVIQGRAGLVFLSAAPATFYRILFDTEGRYTIERLAQNSDRLTRVVDWIEHDAVKRGSDVVNQLGIERQNDIITFFVNDQFLTTFTVPEGESVNHYGFVLTSEVGQGTATFDNLTGERLPS